MPTVHREGDSRFCGATTIVEGQSTVYVNGKLVSVDNDPETHGEGRIIATVASTVLVNGKVITVQGDTAGGDLAFHPLPPTDPSTFSDNVYAG